jgi:hypothetical protein
MKSWFNWRDLRRPKGQVRLPLDLPVETGTAPRLRLVPKKRPLWLRFGRKPSPFDLRPGAIENWMKARPVPHRPARDAAARRPNLDDRGDIGGGR